MKSALYQEQYAAHYESLMCEHIEFILERWERDDYPFIDTKVNTYSGEEFATPERAGTPRGRDVVYGWIQGRAMESLAGHIEWLQNPVTVSHETAKSLRERALKALEPLVAVIEDVRRLNNGRMTFMFSLNGQPLQLGKNGLVEPRDEIRGAANFSDLFAAKGLLAAGRVLNNETVLRSGKKYFEMVVEAINQKSFVSDQEPLNVRNPSPVCPGRLSHGPAMISLGGIARMLSEPNPDFWVRQGASIINGIIQRHVNRGRYEDLEAWDFIEFTDVDGAPWEEDNQILCDPGHALEFIGLTTKFLLAAQSSQVQSNELQNVLVLCRDVLPALFVHVFRCGFDTVNEGIYKTIDLKSRRPVNDELPWWSLPETIRACALLPKVFSENAPKEIPEIWQCCHDALFSKYLNPDCHNLPRQVRSSETGQAIDTVNGFPDVDPAYHAGLSLIDVLRA